jgi:hypothetical protein
LETNVNGQLGSTAANPLFLHNATSQQFEDFLWVFYNECVYSSSSILMLFLTNVLDCVYRSFSIYDASVDTWTSILGFANRWDFQQIRELAIRHLEALDLGLVERILIYQEQDVRRDLILPLYSELVTREAFITPEENSKLGDKTTVLILQARERLRASAKNVKNGINPLPNGVDLTDAVKVLESLLVGFPPTVPLEVSPSSPLTPKVTVSISMVS